MESKIESKIESKMESKMDYLFIYLCQTFWFIEMKMNIIFNSFQ